MSKLEGEETRFKTVRKRLCTYRRARGKAELQQPQLKQQPGCGHGGQVLRLTTELEKSAEQRQRLKDNKDHPGKRTRSTRT